MLSCLSAGLFLYGCGLGQLTWGIGLVEKVRRGSRLWGLGPDDLVGLAVICLVGWGGYFPVRMPRGDAEWSTALTVG